jgi:hypothetical protein
MPPFRGPHPRLPVKTARRPMPLTLPPSPPLDAPAHICLYVLATLTRFSLRTVSWEPPPLVLTARLRLLGMEADAPTAWTRLANGGYVHLTPPTIQLTPLGVLQARHVPLEGYPTASPWHNAVLRHFYALPLPGSHNKESPP